MKGIVNTPGHVHSNKAALDRVTDSVIENSHSHANRAVLDGITADRVQKWDAGGGGSGAPAEADPSYETVQVCNDAHIRFRWAQSGGIHNQACATGSNGGRYELVIIDGSGGYAFGIINDRLKKTDYIKAQNIIDAAKRDGVDYTEITDSEETVVGVKITSATSYGTVMYYNYTENGVNFGDKSGMTLFGAEGALTTAFEEGAPVFYGALYESACNQAMRRYEPAGGSLLDEVDFGMSVSTGKVLVGNMYPSGTYFVKNCPVSGETGACVIVLNAMPLQYKDGAGAMMYMTCFALESGNQYRGLFTDRRFYIDNLTGSYINDKNIGKWYKITAEAVAVE